MRATIDGVDYHVRFQHVALPFLEKRKMPTIHDAIGVISAAMHEIESPGALASQNIDIAGVLSDFVGSYVGACAQVSHRTTCYILSIPTCSHGAEPGQFCGQCDKQLPYPPFENRIVSSGIAFCDKRDNFDRATGRWLAFDKAIAAFPKKAQAEFLNWFIWTGMRLPADLVHTVIELGRLAA